MAMVKSELETPKLPSVRIYLDYLPRAIRHSNKRIVQVKNLFASNDLFASKFWLANFGDLHLDETVVSQRNKLCSHLA